MLKALMCFLFLFNLVTAKAHTGLEFRVKAPTRCEISANLTVD